MKKNKTQIEDFAKMKSFAIIGVSAKSKHKFGNAILKEMVKRGMSVFPIHRDADNLEGVKVYKNLQSLPEKPEGVILCIKPEETLKAVTEINDAGIKNIWFQQGAENQEAVDYCIANRINYIEKECMLMFLEKPGFHVIHKWVWNLVNR
jgi:uncharacterized protein